MDYLVNMRFLLFLSAFLTKPKIFKTDSIPLVFKGFLKSHFSSGNVLSTNKNVDNFILDFFILDFLILDFFILDFHFWIVFDFDFL